MKERWDCEDDARWRKRAAAIAAEVAKDLPWLAKMHEVEAEEERIRNWYLEELEKEERGRTNSAWKNYESRPSASTATW
jgi:hypothetical protein